jgi:hypothetical protein
MTAHFLKKARNTQMAEETTATNMDGQTVTPDAEDAESDVDGCDVPIGENTPDEDLPVSEGGVA